MKKNLMKKFVTTGLVFTMVMGGASAAFAKGNDHDDHGKGGNKNNFKMQSNIQINLNFNDMKSAEWALRYIASLSSKRVFEGYEDGSFRPSNTVSRIEAITAAVRLMGLRDKAESAEEMQTKLNFKDADKVPSWAVGYVAVALENDLFSESDDSVQPNKPADRLWATTLLVKALKLDTEAKTKMNSTLTFKDASKIPAGSIGYIEEAIEKKLIDGFEDNTFRPNQPVTRAQLAALLDRTSNQLPDEDQSVSTGTVNAVVANNVLTLTKNGVSTPYTLHPNVFILRNGVQVSAAQLQVGDEVKVDGFNNIVNYIEVTKMAQQNNVTSGTITAAVYNNNNVLTLTNSAGTTTPYTLSSNVVIYRGGVQVPAVLLQVGDVVNITTSGNQVTIQVTKLAQDNQGIDVIGLFNYSTPDAQGRIATVSLSQNNAATIYNVSPNVVITGDRTQLVQNHLVQLKGYNQVITSIEVK
ncbi:S-layer homology domain-containing protein [Paenibacillus sp. Soil787]|uniref:S-layer homology domain-containing protein n=1 Tax=Paenibacillus sp. Soil787 TaxID=1736411 RepID=UPI0007C86C3B|nr:S-layer homology domain-containing protein [Paenibacillus sp. Soil787]